MIERKRGERWNNHGYGGDGDGDGGHGVSGYGGHGKNKRQKERHFFRNNHKKQTILLVGQGLKQFCYLTIWAR